MGAELGIERLGVHSGDEHTSESLRVYGVFVALVDAKDDIETRESIWYTVDG